MFGYHVKGCLVTAWVITFEGLPERKIIKARFIARWYEDPAVNALVHPAKMARQRSAPVLLALAAIRGSGVRQIDILTGFLKGW